MGTTRIIFQEEWETHKPTISSMYLQEDLTLTEVMGRMRNDHGFDARRTPPEYIAFQTQKRKLEGKETEVLIDGKHVPIKKLKKEISRHISLRPLAATETALAAYIPQGLVIGTPPPVEIARHVEYASIPWFEFQDYIDSPRFQYLNTNDAPIGSRSRLPTDSSQLDFSLKTHSSPTSELINREARTLLADILGVSVEPNSLDYVAMISRTLQAITIQRYEGEIEKHLQKLYSPSSYDSPITLLRYAAYKFSNSPPWTGLDILLEWVVRHGYFWIIKQLIEGKTPTMQIFASHILISSVSLGKADVVESLLEMHVDPNACVGDTTPFNRAAASGNVSIVELFLKHGADPNGHGEKNEMYTPLQAAITSDDSNSSIVQTLIKHSTNLDVPIYGHDDYRGQYVHMTLLTLAANEGSAEYVRLLLEAGVHVNEVIQDSGTALQHSVLCSEVELVHLLVEKGADVNFPVGRAYEEFFSQAARQKRYDLLRTPLQYAAEEDKIEVARILLRAGAEVNHFPVGEIIEHFEPVSLVWVHLHDRPNVPGRLTALQAAAWHGNYDLVQELLDRGANVDAVGIYGTSIQAAIRGPQMSKSVMRLLLSQGPDVNISAQGTTALQAAVVLGDRELVGCCLEARVNINAHSNCEATRATVNRAAHRGNRCLVKLLVKAVVDLHDDAATVDGRTCFEVARDDQPNRMVDYLLEHDASTSCAASTEHGWCRLTTLQIAVGLKDREMVEYLLKKGATTSAPSAVQLAAKLRNLDLVKLLVDAVAEDGNTASIDGQRCLQVAVENRDSEMVDYPCENININGSASIGRGRLLALRIAVEMEDPDMIYEQIKKGADVNERAQDSTTALSMVIRKKNYYAAKMLLVEGADLNQLSEEDGMAYTDMETAALSDSNKSTLRLAIAYGNTGVIRSALEERSNPNSLSNFQLSSLLEDAIYWRAYDMIDLFIRHGADVNVDQGEPLIIAIRNRDARAVKMLLEAKANADASGICQIETALKSAVECNLCEITEMLLKAGANPNASVHPGSKQLTPLKCAVDRKSVPMVQLLLSYGADPNDLGKQYGDTALGTAIKRNRYDIAEIVLRAGADPNASVHSEPGKGALLECAVHENSVPMVQFLLSHGADPNNLGNRYGGTALGTAIQRNRYDIAEILLEAGADPNASERLESRRGTPLRYAVFSQNIPMVQLLLSHGADVNGPGDEHHGTAIQIAAKRGYLRIALILLEAGADINAAPSSGSGRTALEAAAERGRLDMAYLLLQNDNDEGNIKERCQRAAEIASSAGHGVLARLLRDWRKS
ncbi:ankyrin repeat-containing domain protein [Hypoxylon sp. NC1633]|nr:ankyrin repeat-containing domain protein [Hypoxylon sp. NC1633]